MCENSSYLPTFGEKIGEFRPLDGLFESLKVDRHFFAFSIFSEEFRDFFL